MAECSNPVRHSGPNRHEITPADNAIEIPALTIHWADERKAYTGSYWFCSLTCLAEWAAKRAEDHAK